MLRYQRHGHGMSHCPVQDGFAVRLSVDHRPDNAAERRSVGPWGKDFWRVRREACWSKALCFLGGVNLMKIATSKEDALVF